MLIEITSEGKFELDGGTTFDSISKLESFLKLNEGKFAPRLIISSNRTDVAYYHSAMKTLLLFKEICHEYGCLIQNDK